MKHNKNYNIMFKDQIVKEILQSEYISYKYRSEQSFYSSPKKSTYEEWYDEKFLFESQKLKSSLKSFEKNLKSYDNVSLTTSKSIESIHAIIKLIKEHGEKKEVGTKISDEYIHSIVDNCFNCTPREMREILNGNRPELFI